MLDARRPCQHLKPRLVDSKASHRERAQGRGALRVAWLFPGWRCCCIRIERHLRLPKLMPILLKLLAPPPSSVQQMHWPFLAPRVRVSSCVKIAQIEALNCFVFTAFYAAKWFFCIFACRPVSAGTCSLSRAGSAWRRLLYVTQSTLAKSSQPKWESCRVSQVQSLDLPLLPACCSTT